MTLDEKLEDLIDLDPYKSAIIYANAKALEGYAIERTFFPVAEGSIRSIQSYISDYLLNSEVFEVKVKNEEKSDEYYDLKIYVDCNPYGDECERIEV